MEMVAAMDAGRMYGKKEVIIEEDDNAVKRFWVSIEVLGHKGDNLWRKERIAREFLTRCWELSGGEISR